MCAFSYCMSRINIFMLARWHERQLFLRKQCLFQAKSFLILYLTSILYCPQFQQLIAVFSILKLDWNILLFSRSNLFFASDFILSVPPFLFESAHSGALDPVSLRITYGSRAELAFHRPFFSAPRLVQCSKLLKNLPQNPKGGQLELILGVCAIQFF